MVVVGLLDRLRPLRKSDSKKESSVREVMRAYKHASRTQSKTQKTPSTLKRHAESLRRSHLGTEPVSLEEVRERVESRAHQRKRLAKVEKKNVTQRLKDSTPQEEWVTVTPKGRKLGNKTGRSRDHRNWSPNLVAEQEFTELSNARQYAKQMRKQGYYAKIVKTAEGTYKVYVYRKKKSQVKLSKLNTSGGFEKLASKKTLPLMNTNPFAKAKLDASFNTPSFEMPSLRTDSFGADLDMPSFEFDADFGDVSFGADLFSDAFSLNKRKKKP